ncbi:hypothetical protein THAOC_07712, partial [Thalassiosira oceanica]
MGRRRSSRSWMPARRPSCRWTSTAPGRAPGGGGPSGPAARRATRPSSRTGSAGPEGRRRRGRRGGGPRRDGRVGPTVRREFRPRAGRAGGSLPGGIVHASNAVGGEDGGPPERRAPSSPGGELVAAADVGVRVRCILEPTGLGAKVAAARVLSVTNEDKVIYSSDSDAIMSEPKVGTKLSLSYSFTPTTKNGSKSRTPLGEIRVSWTPANLTLPDDVVDSSDASALGDDPRHGPLAVEGAAPVTLLGPACTVVDAPFT